MSSKRRQRRSSPVANEQSTGLPQLPRSLRSRKREFPDETVALSDNQPIQTQVTKIDDEKQALLPQKIPQQPLQGCTEAPFEQTGSEAVHSMQETGANESHSESPSTYTKEIIERAEVIHRETAQNLSIQSSSDYNQKDEEELKANNYNNKPSSTEQLLPSMGTPQGGGGLTTTEEELSQAENLDSQMKCSQEEADLVCAVDDTEAANGFPAKKRRRMGMCGLTEKERSHFLQAQKRDVNLTEGAHGVVVSGGAEGRESLIKDNNEFDQMPAKEIIPLILPPPPSIPVDSIAQQNEIKMERRSACPGREMRSGPCRADTEVEGHSSSTASKSDSHVWSPAVGETCLSDPKVEPGPGQGSEPAPLAESVHTDSVLGMRKNQEGDQNSPQVDNMAAPIEGAGVGGSNSDNASEVSSKDIGAGSGGHSREEHCMAAATPSVSKENGNCGGPDENLEPGPSSVKQLQSENPRNSLGSWSLDYVSDSQLHNIILNDDQVIRGGEDGHEDAKDLVCGLIRELSSLNRTVMTAHRELENMRRGNKGSRASIRRVFGAGSAQKLQ